MADHDPDDDLARCLTLVVAVDGLRAASLGAYGQTTYETPAFDQLATEAVTYSEAYAATPDPRDLYAQLAKSRAIPPSAVLLTDDAAITEPIAEAFDRVVVIDPPTLDDLAPTIDQTAMAAVWADFAVALIEALGDDGEPPPLVWLHTRGLRGPWDAPPETYASLIDEDDPEVATDVTPPESETDDEDAQDDAQFAAACRYAGQVMTLDACLAGWLDLADGLLEGTEHRLIVTGVRGYALGEHGRIGTTDDRLFTELQHVPLLIREPGIDRRFVREADPTSLDAVLASLGSQPSADQPVTLASPSGAASVLTTDWLLRRPADSATAIELYVKPDDRWEQNDIASLEPAVADELLALLTDGDSAVAAPPQGL